MTFPDTATRIVRAAAWIAALTCLTCIACGGRDAAGRNGAASDGPGLAGSGARDAARPAELLPVAAMRDVPSLALVVGPDERRPSRTDPARSLIANRVEFTSFRWEGETWSHRATWLRPADRAPVCDDCAAISDDLELAEAAALDGVPALAIESGFPGTRYGIADEGALMTDSLRGFFRDGDTRRIGYGWLARVYVRAATAVGQLPGSTGGRIAIAGCSKRGVATWIAAAADDRIVGGMAACWNGANAAAWLRHKQERWGDRRPGTQPGPAWQDAQRQIDMVEGPHGAELLALTDPATFVEDLHGKRMLIAVGTDDPLYPVTGDRVYFDLLPDGTRMALVPNVGHRVAPRHVQAWRHWLRVALEGADSPPLRPTLEPAGPDALLVRLPARGAPAPPGRLAVWSMTDRTGGAFRHASFSAEAMTLDGSDWTATLPAPTGEERLGWFVSWSVEDQEAPVWRTSTFREFVPGAKAAAAQASTTRSPSRAVQAR